MIFNHENKLRLTTNLRNRRLSNKVKLDRNYNVSPQRFMKPLNSIVNIILLTMSVLLVVSGDHSIIEQDSLRSIIYFVFILFKTNISSRRANILFANSVTEPLISLVTVQNSMDRSINSTCNKQTIVS